MRWIVNYFHKLNRRTDMSVLWPSCKEHAKTIDHAKAAFFLHISHDPAWTDHYTNEELSDFVTKLT